MLEPSISVLSPPRPRMTVFAMTPPLITNFYFSH
jgi:hypothetical protein